MKNILIGTLKRLLDAIPVLIGVVLLIFIMLRIVPGDPVTTMLGEHVNEDVVKKMTAELGLDKPLYEQFFIYLKGLVTLDLGTSYTLKAPVSRLIGESFPATLQLSLLAALFAWIIGIFSGIIAAIHQNKILDRLFMGFSLLGISMPVFMIALLLQYFLAFKLKIFPISGYGSFLQLILPSIALGWNSAGSISRLTRSNLIEVMQEDYIDTARAKGLYKWKVILFHALRNSLLPVVTMMAIQLSSMLSGAVITESVFGIGGIGQLAVNAISCRDMPLLQGTVLFTTILVMLGNLIADSLYAVLDPRIRKGAI